MVCWCKFRTSEYHLLAIAIISKPNFHIIFSRALYDSISHSLSISPLVSSLVTPFIFGILQTVFTSPLLPNHMRLLPSYIRHPPLSLSSRLPLLPNHHNFCCHVYGLVFLSLCSSRKRTNNWTLLVTLDGF